MDSPLLPNLLFKLELFCQEGVLSSIHFLGELFKLLGDLVTLRRVGCRDHGALAGASRVVTSAKLHLFFGLECKHFVSLTDLNFVNMFLLLVTATRCLSFLLKVLVNLECLPLILGIISIVVDLLVVVVYLHFLIVIFMVIDRLLYEVFLRYTGRFCFLSFVNENGQDILDDLNVAVGWEVVLDDLFDGAFAPLFDVGIDA